jgi:hypothetical protein
MAACRTLRRLVCFVAAALDVRFAFVAAVEDPLAARGVRSASLWLARDFGLRSDFARLELPEALPEGASSADWATALRQVWPDEHELAEPAEVRCITVALCDPPDRVVGYLGLVDSELGSGLLLLERLRPLRRLALAELQRWAGGFDAGNDQG